MKINKFVIFLVPLFIFGCGSKQSVNSKIYTGKYPPIIDSLNIEHLYDSTKWNIYLLYCMDTPQTTNGDYILSNNTCYGSLDLKFDSLGISKDTFRLYFDFYANDTQAINVFTYKELKGYKNGLMFYSKMEPNTKCYVYNYSGWSSMCIEPLSKEIYDTTTNRFVKPLQAEVIEFIEKNQTVLNPWFVMEAKKRGLIK